MPDYEFPALPTNIGVSYPDRTQADRAHQLHHDSIHQGLIDFNASGLANADKALDHGNVTGTEAIDTAIGFHQLTLTGDVVLQLDDTGRQVAFLVIQDGTGGHACTVEGVGFQPGIDAAAGAETMFAALSFPAGWRITSGSLEATEITPADVTFTDGSNTIHVPAQVGGHYEKDDVELATGDHPGNPEGDVNVVFVIDSGYVLSAGAQTEWPHTFGPLDADPLTPEEIGDIAGMWDVSVTASVTLAATKISAIADVGPNAQGSFAQATDANRPTKVTVNGLDAAQFVDSTDQMQRTSFPAGPMLGTDKTTFFVVRMDQTSFASGDQALLELAGAQFALKTGGKIWPEPGDIKTPNSATNIFVADCWTNGDVVVMVRTVPTAGDSKLWVSSVDTPAQGSLVTGGSAHGFIGGNAASIMTACQWGAFDKVLSDAEVAGLISHLRAKWGTL